MKLVIRGIGKTGAKGFALRGVSLGQEGQVNAVSFTLKNGTKHPVLASDNVIWENHQITTETKAGFAQMLAIVEARKGAPALVEAEITVAEVTKAQIAEAKAAAKTTGTKVTDEI